MSTRLAKSLSQRMRWVYYCAFLRLLLPFSTVPSQPLPSPAQEIDYPVVINSGLPEDIRVLGWCDLPDTFSARFSARHRTYRYFFPRRDLDIEVRAGNRIGYVRAIHFQYLTQRS